MSVLVVLDTNIIISAGIKPGSNPARIVDAALAGAIVPVVCPTIITEYVEVVNRAKFKKWRFPPLWLTALINGSHLVDQDLAPWPKAGPDPDDLIFLALAHRTGAVLVTGNLDDYPLDIRPPVEVISPDAYLKHLCDLGIQW